MIEIVRNGSRSIIVTDSNHPVTLMFRGTRLGLKVRALTSAGTGVAKGSGPARYYGQLSGTVTVGSNAAVKRDGRSVKAIRLRGTAHTTARVSRRGRYFLVKLTAKASAGVQATYFRFGKGAVQLYTRPLRLTRAQLRALHFASIDLLGVWEHSERASVPH